MHAVPAIDYNLTTNCNILKQKQKIVELNAERVVELVVELVVEPVLEPVVELVVEPAKMNTRKPS